LLDRDRVFWRINKAIILYCYVLIRTNPDIFLSRRFAACESTILYGRSAGNVVNSPKAGRVAETAVFDRDVVSFDNHRGAAKIDAAKHSAGLSDVHDIRRWGVIVGRTSLLSDFRDVEQRGRGVRVAGHGVDPRQNGSGIVVADFLDVFGGDHAIVPRSQRGKPRRTEQ
jgi:hypothetical protein